MRDPKRCRSCFRWQLKTIIVNSCVDISSSSRELLRRVRRLGAEIVPERGKGGHVMVRRGERVTYVPTGSGELAPGTLASILKALGLRRDQI